MTGIGTGTEHSYRSHYLGQPVLIKGYIPKITSKNIDFGERAQANVKLHVELGDFIAWGENKNAPWGLPRYMVVIKDNSDYHSASSTAAILSWDQVEVLRSHAYDTDLSQRKNKP